MEQDDDELLATALAASEAEYAAEQAEINAAMFASLYHPQWDPELNDAQVAQEMYMVQLGDASSSDELLARLSMAEGSSSQEVNTFIKEIVNALAARDDFLEGVDTMSDEEIASSMVEAMNDEEMAFILFFLTGNGSQQGVDTTNDQEIARSLAGGGGSQGVDTFNDEEMARMMYEAQFHEEGSAAGSESAEAIAKVIAENAQIAKQRDEPPPPPLEGGLEGLANHGQNVHVSAVEQPAMRTMEELLQRPLPPQMCPHDMIQELHQQISRPDLTCSPVNLLPNAQQGALVVLTSPDQLQVRCSRSQRIFEDVLVAVWNVVRNHKDKDELIRRLAEEIHEGVGQCNTGRITRLVNALRGFVDIGGQDVAQVPSLT